MEFVPDWIIAVTAVLAFGAAMWAGHISRSLLNVELERTHATDERERRAQATHIAAWTVHCPEKQADDATQYGVVVKNSSPSAVYDVRIASTGSNDTPKAPIVMSILPPGEFAVLGHAYHPWSFPKPITEIRGAIRPITKDAKWAVNVVLFTDAQGVRWRREGAALDPAMVEST